MWFTLWGIASITGCFLFNAYIVLKTWWSTPFTRALRSELWGITSFVAFPLWISYEIWVMGITGDTFDRVFLGVFLPINLLLWYFVIYKDDDRDDRWKKRRNKALRKVKQVGGKLVVVPAPAGVKP